MQSSTDIQQPSLGHQDNSESPTKYVVKRNGSHQPLDLGKLRRRFEDKS